MEDDLSFCAIVNEIPAAGTILCGDSHSVNAAAPSMLGQECAMLLAEGVGPKYLASLLRVVEQNRCTIVFQGAVFKWTWLRGLGKILS